MPDLTPEANVEIATRILSIRGQRVLLDQDLALLYGVTIKRLNQQVRRNMEKFPGDFLFQLDPAEADSLRMHFASLKKGRGSHRKPNRLAIGIFKITDCDVKDQPRRLAPAPAYDRKWMT